MVQSPYESDISQGRAAFFADIQAKKKHLPHREETDAFVQYIYMPHAIVGL